MPAATSQIDATKPADNVKVDKADIRGNFQAAKSEINRLLRTTRPPWQVAVGTLSW